jgi:hypothetical protein
MERKINILDKIGSLIPGYRGYAEKDGRRNCDKLLRDSIVVQLVEIENVLHLMMADSLKNKDKERMHNLEALRKQIDTFRSKVNFAPYGKSALFTDEQINEDELSNIYQYDYDLANEVSNLQTLIQGGEISAIAFVFKQCNEILQKRNNYINKFK